MRKVDEGKRDRKKCYEGSNNRRERGREGGRKRWRERERWKCKKIGAAKEECGKEEERQEEREE